MNSTKLDAPVFDPKDPAYRGKLWVQLTSRQGPFRHFFWRRILGVCGVLLALGWLGMTGAVWANLKLRRGFSEVRYADLVLPWRWPRYMAAMSGHYVAMGNAALEHGSPDSAFYLFNAALAMRPNNPEARRLAALAQFRMGLKRVAWSSLTAGLAAADATDNEPYLRQYFGMAFEMQADDEAYRAGLALLPAKPDQKKTHLLIAFQLATARFNSGYWADAEKLLTDWNLRGFPEGLVLYAQCQWESGQMEQALQSLQGGLARFGQRDALYAAMEQFTRAQRRPEATLNFAILRQLADPEHAAPQLDLLYAYHALNRRAEEQRVLETYFKAFRTDFSALGQLTQFAVDSGQPAIAERVRVLVRAAGKESAGFELAVAEAAVGGHDYAAASRALDRLKGQKATANRTFQATVSGLEVLFKFGTGDAGAELTFGNFLATAAALRPPEALLLAKDLRDAGQPRLSGELLERVYFSNADSEPILVELVREEIRAGDRTKLLNHLPPLFKMRKVPREILTGALLLLNRSEDAALRIEANVLLKHSPAEPLSNKR